MMIIGLPSKPIQVSTHALMLGQYRIKAETTGPPFMLPKAFAFTAKHNIQTRVEFYKIEEPTPWSKRRTNVLKVQIHRACIQKRECVDILRDQCLSLCGELGSLENRILF
jgi:D-arabinose 1-dehydrogenase-like Zn-dependent alcohol dehydrogenase